MNRFATLFRSGISSWALLAGLALATEYHVSPTGDDANSGGPGSRLRTIGEGARRAQPGDTVTVHEGVYRERINPPRGGTGENARIVYQAAPGENVVIKGSEATSGWQLVGGDTWKLTVPNTYFGLFNPFNNLIVADWFQGANRHTGAVYLNGVWLNEATTKAAVLQAAGAAPMWFAEVEGGGSLLNVGWLQPYHAATAGTRMDASFFDRDLNVINAANSEGGFCVGFIESGDWTRYDTVDFGTDADSLKIRAASATIGGVIEVRLDNPTGTLLGSTTVSNTGGWQTWQTFTASITSTSGTHKVCLVYRSPVYTAGNTTIWAQFPGKNPNTALTEINARQCVFYPEETGINYITVRGFTLEQAATPWSPPTAEQIGLIGTHWSKGWIIENNTVRFSSCSGVSLGKYGDRWDNASGTTLGYVGTLDRAELNGWKKNNIGGHVVRNNHISNCEQSGIVGSLGGAFSTIIGNHIHDIHILNLFTGQEMAGIKLHGAIDTQIIGNHIHRCDRGIWLDWMAQGSRVSGCLLHDNVQQDIFLEVNHGPTLLDHNVLLSSSALLDASEGECYAHNLFAGTLVYTPNDGRSTPYHPAHDTAIAGYATLGSGDSRFYNNIFTGSASLAAYKNTTRPLAMSGNVFLNGASPSPIETSPLVLPAFNPNLHLGGGPTGYYLQMTVDPTWGTLRTRPLVTTALMARAVTPDALFENPDGTALQLSVDYLGAFHSVSNPFPGPFENGATGTSAWKVSSAPYPYAPAQGTPAMECIHIDIEGGQTAGTAGAFGGTPSTVLGAAGDTWNAVTPGNNTSGSASALVNSAGVASSTTLAWTPNHWSYDNGSPAAAYRDLLGDYAYIYSSGRSSSTWTFGGLAAEGTYKIVIYAANGTSGGKWTINGVTKEAVPTASTANLAEGQQYVSFSDIQPDSAGQIAISFSIRSGQSYGEMAGIEIETTSLSSSTTTMAVTHAGFNNGVFEITATGLNPIGRYVLTRSANLQDGFPTIVGSPFLAGASTVVLSDLSPPSGKAFYRIEKLP